MSSPLLAAGPLRSFVIAAAALLLASTLQAAESAARESVRLLTIGNSFSQNATHYLEDLAKADGRTLVHHRCVIGGATMQQHWDKAQQHEANAEDPQGFYTSKKSLKQELGAEPWDYVTIQQASIKSHDVASYRPFATQLRDYVTKYAPGATVILHETWAYRVDDPRFKGTGAEGEPKTQEEMYQGLRAAYRTIAQELGVKLLPVGDAFHLADTDAKWGYRPDASFDANGAKQPQLPDQSHSLHVGWRWVKDASGTTALKMDGHHANTAGEYLGGCVWYEVLFHANVVGNKYAPAGIEPEYARFLQETAHRAVAKSASEN